MKKIRLERIVLFLLFASFVFCGCDKMGNEHFELYNQTDSVIILKFKVDETNATSIITKSIESNKVLNFFTESTMNKGVSDRFNDSITVFSLFKVGTIKNNDTVYSSKNFKVRSKWSYSESGRWNSTYQLIIKKEDL